ncbi:hypothetical protein C7N43_26285 [Sphingobacteriales bacterium UPWRP_1]|nr:hypothetical protein B6N25_13825 [Sphingobacteriales bacterium TSM_CSS]PSJ73989.1 hypothetical protein C7N43_26285 [Sphingobacteriales bacterium UPWRP_1]
MCAAAVFAFGAICFYKYRYSETQGAKKQTSAQRGINRAVFWRTCCKYISKKTGATQLFFCFLQNIF